MRGVSARVHNIRCEHYSRQHECERQDGKCERHKKLKYLM